VEHPSSTTSPSFDCCSEESLYKASDALTPILDVIVQHPYFRYVRVNTEKECPYWAVSMLCTNQDAPCTVWTCNPEEVPKVLQCEDDMCHVQLDRVHHSPFPEAIPKKFFVGGRDPHAVYVNLVDNVEANTGYVGFMAHRVWDAIYQENCFFEQGVVSCEREKVFHRFISGLHSSISVHLAMKYKLRRDGTYASNCSEMHRRVLDHPERISNLLFLYQFVLQAVAAVKGTFLGDVHQFVSGVAVEDENLVVNLKSLFSASQLFRNTTFDSKALTAFLSTHRLLSQVTQHMQNVTTLMDCLECEKCRVWAKVQTTGLATAIEVNTAIDGAIGELQRSKVVSLMNLFRQLTHSVRYVGTECR